MAEGTSINYSSRIGTLAIFCAVAKGVWQSGTDLNMGMGGRRRRVKKSEHWRTDGTKGRKQNNAPTKSWKQGHVLRKSCK